MKKPKLTEDDSVMKKLESMDNKLDVIKTEITNINRIQSLVNTDVITDELRNLIGGSKVRAAILYLTKQKMGTKELADALGISEGNLPRDLEPFLGTRAYLFVERDGVKKYYIRAQIVDLIGYERITEFMDLVNAWKDKRLKEKQVDPAKEAKASNGT